MHLHSSRKLLLLFFYLSSFPVCGFQENVPAEQGSIENGNTYKNLALGMTMVLPGSWHLIGKATGLGSNTSGKNSRLSNCQGPLCSQPSIDIAMASSADNRSSHAILLAAYKLSREYQDPRRHPLKKFAEVMTLRSLGGLWIPESGLTPVSLSGKPAFKLVVHNKKNPTAKSFLYVSNSNGYVFMLVGTAMSAPDELQSAIERMQLVTGP